MRTMVVIAIVSFSAGIVIKKCRENDIRVIGCDMYPGKWIADAKSVDAFYQVPYVSDTDHYIETTLSIYRKEGTEAVTPPTDAKIDVFNLHRHEFGEINTILCMSDKTCIGLYRDKMELYRYLEEHMEGTMIPTARLEGADLDKISYPAVYKPCNGRSSQGPRFVGSRREMEGFLGETDPAGYIVQPMIKGSVVTVGIVRGPEQGTCAAVRRRELLRVLSGAGTSVLVFRNRQLEEWRRAIVGLLGVRGYVGVEFIEGRGGIYHVLGCSPRFSGEVEFSCLAGYDCVTNHLRRFGGREIEWDDRIKSMYIAREYEEYITKVEWQGGVTGYGRQSGR